MKNKTLSLLAAGLFSGALLCQQAQAIPISGSVDMAGAVTLNSATLATATAALAFGPSIVTSGTGTFAGASPSPVLWMTPFSWLPPNTPISSLWSFAFGGRTYSFDLLSVTSVFNNGSFLNVTGLGVLKVTAGVPIYDDTAGSFSFTIPSAGSGTDFIFGFAASNSALPDGGLTIAFLGSALVGLGMLRRKLS